MYAQTPTVTLKLDNAPVKEILTQIEKVTGYVFIYQFGTIDLARKVTVNVSNTPLNDVLKRVFKDSGVTWTIRKRQISLKQGEVSTGQKKKSSVHTLTGVVTDATNSDPLIGASVVIKGDKVVGTVTDLDGKFTLSVGSDDEVVFSYIGYQSQTLVVGDLGVLNVAMQPDNTTLSEVVVVGAGTQAKVSVTGSISSIKGDVIKAPSSSLTSNFAGKLAGVISSTTSGEPGSVSEFYIRGVGTFGGRATPLILLDDIEISSADLNRIPAESIENFSILKDPCRYFQSGGGIQRNRRTF